MENHRRQVFATIAKTATWTAAQATAWVALVERSDLDPIEVLARTNGGVMPGIGGAINGDVGTIGITDFNGIFVGIEPDGYTHS